MVTHFRLERNAGFHNEVAVYVWQNSTKATERVKDLIETDLDDPTNFNDLVAAVEVAKLEMNDARTSSV